MSTCCGDTSVPKKLISVSAFQNVRSLVPSASKGVSATLRVFAGLLYVFCVLTPFPQAKAAVENGGECPQVAGEEGLRNRLPRPCERDERDSRGDDVNRDTQSPAGTEQQYDHEQDTSGAVKN